MGILLTGIKLIGDGVAGTSSTSIGIVVGTTKLRGENCPFVAASSVVIGVGAVVVVAGETVVVGARGGSSPKI